MTAPVRTGLIGYGFGGAALHAPAISRVAGLKLAAVATRQGDRVRQDWPGTRAVGVQDLLGDPEIELVVVAAPNDLHLPLARQALQQGKHVVVDKPFAETWAQARELADLAEATGRLLSVFHNRRYDGDFRLLQKVLSEGRIGRPVMLESRFDRFRPQPKERWRELPGIGVDVPNRPLEFRREANVFRNEPAQHLLHIAHDIVDRCLSSCHH